MKTPGPHCRGHRFDPWFRDPALPHDVAPNQQTHNNNQKGTGEKEKKKKLNIWISQRQKILGNIFLIKYSVSGLQYYS